LKKHGNIPLWGAPTIV